MILIPPSDEKQGCSSHTRKAALRVKLALQCKMGCGRSARAGRPDAPPSCGPQCACEEPRHARRSVAKHSEAEEREAAGEAVGEASAAAGTSSDGIGGSAGGGAFQSEGALRRLHEREAPGAGDGQEHCEREGRGSPGRGEGSRVVKRVVPVLM